MASVGLTVQGVPVTLGVASVFLGGQLAGPAGQSAYQIAVAGGFAGTEAQWLASLQGAPGRNGTDGTNGAPGIVQSIVAGANVTVDATDPAHPVVAAAADTGGGAQTDWDATTGAAVLLNKPSLEAPSAQNSPVAVGASASTHGLGDVAIGCGAYTYGAGGNSASVSIGSYAYAASGACGIGAGAQAYAAGAMALGQNANVQGGAGAMALGQNANVQGGAGAMALGQNAKTQGGAGAIAIGSGAYGYGANSVALGSGARNTAANQLTLGAVGTTVNAGGLFRLTVGTTFSLESMSTTAAPVGCIAFASDALDVGEAAGAGTGCIVVKKSSGWVRVADNTPLPTVA